MIPEGSSIPLAIVGMGVRVRGASGPEELWALLRDGRDVVGPAPSRGWENAYDPDPFAPGKSVSQFGSFLDTVDGIDWRFFGLSPREARSTDPQHRLLLEVAWETLEDAGIPPARAAGSRAGVFVGIMLNDYGRLYGRDLRAIDGYTIPNNTFAYAANRISFFFDLRGPSMALDTLCSSSLLAFHQACRSVATGESDWALAGGVSLILAPDTDISMSKATALSPTGRIRLWDAKADGFVRGEGAGLVLVKPLASALADGDRVYAVVLGSATNHKGRGNWLVEPSSGAQADVIRAACAAAGIGPDEVDYVELHGTGTPKGDPVEAEALGTAMARREVDRPCQVGSIKTNVGHLDAAAGIVGLIKTALCIHHRELVPSLHFENCNPLIDLERLKVRVQTTRTPWPRPDALPVAGVTSIGFGGTNVHAILRGIDPQAVATPEQKSYVLPLSAKSDIALRRLAERFAGWLADGHTNLADVCHTLGARRTHHERRFAVAGGSPSEVASKLRDFTRGGESIVTTSARTLERLPRRVFVFPGHGPQWLGMARDLVGANRVFTDAIAKSDSLVVRETGWSVIAELFAQQQQSRLERPDVVQPVLFAVEVALAALWRSWGVVPDVVVGHSVGEIAAAVVGGALALEDGVRIVCARGRWTQLRAGLGGVAVVALPSDEVREALGSYETLEVGGENTASSTIVTGGVADLEAFLAILRGQGVFARRVQLGYASHSRDMEAILDDFAADVGQVEPRPGAVSFCSTVFGRFVDAGELATSYWKRNLRDPVLFACALKAIGQAEPSVFLEVSPHPVLTSAVAENLTGSENVLAIAASLRRGSSSLTALDESLAALYAAGCNVDWSGRYPAGRVVSTPPYPWQRERMWLDTAGAGRDEGGSGGVHPLLGRAADSASADTLSWEHTLAGPETAYFCDHGLQGVPSLSTSAMVEAMVVAASHALGTEALEVVDLELRRAFLLPRSGAYRIQTLLTRATHGDEWTAEVRGRADTLDARWRTHATARVRAASSPPHAPHFDAPLASRLSTETAYAELANLGLQYGPAFHGIEWLTREGEEVLARVRLPDGLDARPYFFHPALHDAALHVAVLAESCRGHYGILPVRISRLWFHSRPGKTLLSHARVTRAAGGLRADVRVENADGAIVEIVEGIELAHLDDAIVTSDVPPELTAEEASWLYGVEWTALPPVTHTLARETTEPRTWLILTDRGDRPSVGEALARRMRAHGFRAVVLAADEVARSARADEDLAQSLARRIGTSVRSGSLAGAVHLWSLDVPDLDTIEPGEIDGAVTRSCDTAVHLLRALETVEETRATPVWFVTRGAQPWGLKARHMAPLQAPLWGLARAVAAELPSRWGGLVDLDPLATPADCAAQLWGWLRALREGEDEVLFRRGTIYGGRLERQVIESRRSLEFRPDASYLVTGGTGGLGLTVARWLAREGAKHLVLAARTPIPPREDWADVPEASPLAETIGALQAIESLGATVHPVALDVSNHPAVLEYLNEHDRKGLPPIRGVFHLAGTVHIEDVLQMDSDALIEVLQPKVHGTIALHRWVEDLDMFVLFSSASSTIRSPRLAHYAAGNAFLDAMAHYRRARGQAAISIDWGLWSEVGFIRRLGNRGPAAIHGMKSMSPEAGVRILQRLVESDATQAVVWPPDWKQWSDVDPGFARASLVRHLVGAPSSFGDAPSAEPEPDLRTGNTTIRAPWTAVPDGRSAGLGDQVARLVATQLRLPVDQLPREMPLEQLGFDSLLATELQVRLHRELGVRIPLMRLLRFSSVETIADEVMECVEKESRSGSQTSSVGDLATASEAGDHDNRTMTRSGVMPIATDVREGKRGQGNG